MRALTLSLALLLILCGCGPKKTWHMSDVSGAVPDLSFSMQRASDGAMVTGESYRGKVVLVYFGYTHCPDVCPTTLSDLADALSKLGPEAAKVRVLFVSVDPERDTLELLKGYARSFGPQVDGLRGTENEIADTARRYRVAYSVKKKPEYTVMHTSAVYVFDQNGKARLVTTDTRDPAGIAADLKEIVAGG